MNIDENLSRQIGEYLGKLNFNETEIKIFLLLLEKGPMTALEISREAEIERTKIYRTIDGVRNKGLIEKLEAHKTSIFKACEPEKLKILLSRYEERLENLKGSFADFSTAVSSIQDISRLPNTEVLFYKGQEGIEQILWNSLRAKNEILSFVHRTLYEVTSFKFFEEWVDEIFAKKIRFREIRSAEFEESDMEFKEKCKKMFEEKGGYPGESIYIKDEIFKITHRVDIYNDTVAIYALKDGDVFGIEIKSQVVADMQKNIFELLWKLGR